MGLDGLGSRCMIFEIKHSHTFTFYLAPVLHNNHEFRCFSNSLNPLFMKVVAIIFIVAGILMLIFRGFSFTQEKKLVDVGPLEINKKEEKSVGWPMYAGGLALAAGIIILVVDKKKS